MFGHPVEVGLLLIDGDDEGMVGVHVAQLGQITAAQLINKKIFKDER